jgi:tetratricopeptide (TPR) repeat protein
MQGFNIFLRGLGPDNFERARQMFERVIERDPESIRGLAGVSLTNSMGVIFQWAPDREAATRRAQETLARLEAIDPNDHLTLLARASLANMRADWEGLYAISTTLLEHFPNDPTSHHHRCSSLLRLGSFDAAIPACERAIRISPRDSRAPIWNGLIGMNEFMRGRYGAAAERARIMVTANSRVPFYSLLLAAALANDGKRAEGEQLIAEFKTRNPTFDSARIAVLWPANNPKFVEGRERIAAAVRELGLP